MTTIITRLYETKEIAEAVVADLRAEGFRAGDIDHFVVDNAPEFEADEGGLLQGMKAAGVYDSAAQAYTQKVASGAALVVVRAPTGFGLKALEIVDARASVDAGVKFPDRHYGSPAPVQIIRRRYGARLVKSDTKVMSGATLPGVVQGRVTAGLGMPMLSKRTPKPRKKSNKSPLMSERFGMKVLSKTRDRRSAMRGGGLVFSSMLGIPPLIKKRR